MKIELSIEKSKNEELKSNTDDKLNNDANDKLYKEIYDLNEKLKRYPVVLEQNEKLISIIFTSSEQKKYYSIICKNTDNINKLETEIYKEFPDFIETDNYFLCKGHKINKFQTFEMNHIVNGDLIIINKKDLIEFK